ncbi:MAG TPA: hypothetical protein VEH49_09985 [Methylomirabilota bacterium]|nr:hypothetical protein [Methylomirabilota bacterium]
MLKLYPILIAFLRLEQIRDVIPNPRAARVRNLLSLLAAGLRPRLSRSLKSDKIDVIPNPRTARVRNLLSLLAAGLRPRFSRFSTQTKSMSFRTRAKRE